MLNFEAATSNFLMVPESLAANLKKAGILMYKKWF
jgi:hypothetical protein